MASPISAYDTYKTGADAPKDITKSDVGDKVALDVSVISSVPAGTTDTTATIFNINLGPADTEQSQALPANTKEFIIKSRNGAQLKLAYALGDSGSSYILLKGGAVFTDNNMYSSQTIYFQSSQTGDVVEIIAYT